MIYIDFANIQSNQYKKLINYFLSKCDEISFHLPGVYDNGKPMDDKLWQEYHNNTKHFLQTCFNNGAKQSISRQYHGMRLSHFSKVIYVKPFQELTNTLLCNHLLDWLVCNNLPEDVCFYYKKNTRIFTCSHENEFYIDNETEEDIDFLKNNSIDFIVRKK